MAARVIKQFVVGDKDKGADFSVEEIETLIHKIAYWFSRPECDRNYDDPVESAKQKVKECLRAETEAGEPWRNCPKEFAARVKAKCNFDMATGQGIPSPRVKRTEGRVLDAAAKEGAKLIDGMTPASAEFDHVRYREQLEHDILTQYPELDNPAHKPLVRSISMYHAEREKIDRELALGVNATRRDLLLDSLKKIAMMCDAALTQLGIHPNQIKKNISARTASSVSDLVTMIEGDADYRHREKVWALQLALQLWWMSEHPNGKKSDRQLSDFEIWHMTRNRPVKFRCRHGEEYVVVEGFEPKDLHDLLVKEGVLVEEPVIPGLFTPEELVGLSDYFTKEGSNGGRDANDGSDAAGSEAAATTADSPAGPQAAAEG